MQLILASQSPYRKAQLESLGLTFLAIKPEVNEEQLKKDGPDDLVELTRFLALHKANSLHAKYPDAIVIGSDQMAEVDGQRLDKPGSKKRARQQLQRLQGRKHRLLTSLCVVHGEVTHMFTDITTLHMRQLDAVAIDAYLEQDQPYDCAGSYKFERGGIALIEHIETQDPSAIQGLPLMSLTNAFNKLNIPWHQLWRKT